MSSINYYMSFPSKGSSRWNGTSTSTVEVASYQNNFHIRRWRRWPFGFCDAQQGPMTNVLGQPFWIQVLIFESWRLTECDWPGTLTVTSENKITRQADRLEKNFLIPLNGGSKSNGGSKAKLFHVEVSGMKISTPTESFSVEVPFGGTWEG